MRIYPFQTRKSVSEPLGPFLTRRSVSEPSVHSLPRESPPQDSRSPLRGVALERQPMAQDDRSQITPPSLYLRRRAFLALGAGSAVGTAALAFAQRALAKVEP